MDLNKNTYLNFEFDDFIIDEAFQNWVINATRKDDEFWQEFILANQDRAHTIEQAREFIQNIRFAEHLPNEDNINHSFAQHMQMVNEYKEKAVAVSLPAKRRLNLTGIAAVFALLVMSIALRWYFTEYNGEQTYHAAFGETRKIKLPDSSVITLQANSTIRYAKHWSDSKPRQVWLNGEAYFAVRHINQKPANVRPGERFIVNTKALSVEVLGTVFNIKERRGITAVVLESGKVKVMLNKGSKMVNGLTTWYLKPGEGIKYNQNENALPVVKPANTTVTTAWAKGLIVFDGITTKDMLDYLADNYGYHIVVKDTSIYKYQLSGKLKLESERDLIFTLENVLKLSVFKTDSTLTIQKRTPN